MKIRAVDTELFHADGQIDMANFSNAPKMMYADKETSSSFITRRHGCMHASSLHLLSQAICPRPEDCGLNAAEQSLLFRFSFHGITLRNLTQAAEHEVEVLGMSTVETEQV